MQAATNHHTRGWGIPGLVQLMHFIPWIESQSILGWKGHTRVIKSRSWFGQNDNTGLKGGGTSIKLRTSQPGFKLIWSDFLHVTGWHLILCWDAMTYIWSYTSDHPWHFRPVLVPRGQTGSLLRRTPVCSSISTHLRAAAEDTSSQSLL